MRSRPRLAAYDIGGPQLPFTPRASSCSSAGLTNHQSPARPRHRRGRSRRSCRHASTSRPPVRQAVASCASASCASASCAVGVFDRLGVMLPERGNCSRFAAPDGAQQIFRLVLQLIEIGMDGKGDGRPSQPRSPGVRAAQRASTTPPPSAVRTTSRPFVPASVLTL